MCWRGRYNRIIPLFSHIAPLIPAERHVHLHFPRIVHIYPQRVKMMCRALHIEEIRSLRHITKDEVIILLDECAPSRAGGGQG